MQIAKNLYLQTKALGFAAETEKAKFLYEYALSLKEEIYSKPPRYRGFTNNKNYARLFYGKERDEINSLLKGNKS